MRRDKKPVGRWFGEAILIFLSVFGAFYFDNIREERNSDDVYIRHLLDFRADLTQNQSKFKYELQKVPNQPNSDYIATCIDQLNFVDSLMMTPIRSNADTIISMINSRAMSLIGLTKWIYHSPQYEKLNADYYSFIENSNMKGQLEMHYRNNAGRHHLKDLINEYVHEFEGIQDNMNLDRGGTPNNRAILFSNPSINKIKRIRRNFYSLENYTQSNKSQDSLLLIEVDKELKFWGIED